MCIVGVPSELTCLVFILQHSSHVTQSLEEEVGACSVSAFYILNFTFSSFFSFIAVLIWLQYVNFHIWMKDIKEICEKKKMFFRNIRNQMVAKYKKRHSCHCIVILKILFLLGIRNPDLGKKWSQLMKGHWEANIIIY